MRKVVAIAFVVCLLGACKSHSDQGGSVNDGIKAVDSNGGLADTVNLHNGPATDTSKMEDRVDLSKRDTFKNK